MKKPVGMLNVKVIGASNLKKMDILGKSDPYVKLKLTGDKLQSRKTTVKMNNLNPEWNEAFNFVVKDPGSQVLELYAYDWDKAWPFVFYFHKSLILFFSYLFSFIL